jgi:predicted transcriptional regulator
MERVQACLTIPIRLSRHGIYHASRLRLSSLQARIIIELAKRPCYLNMLARRLSKPNNVILDSLRSLIRRNIVGSIIYVSPKIKDKAGVRRYYVIRNTRYGHNNRKTGKIIHDLREIFIQDDESIERMRTYYKAMNMLQSPNPIKQSMGRRLLEQLDTHTP